MAAPIRRDHDPRLHRHAAQAAQAAICRKRNPRGPRARTLPTTSNRPSRAIGQGHRRRHSRPQARPDARPGRRRALCRRARRRRRTAHGSKRSAAKSGWRSAPDCGIGGHEPHHPLARPVPARRLRPAGAARRARADREAPAPAPAAKAAVPSLKGQWRVVGPAALDLTIADGTATLSARAACAAASPSPRRATRSPSPPRPPAAAIAAASPSAAAGSRLRRFGRRQPRLVRRRTGAGHAVGLSAACSTLERR